MPKMSVEMMTAGVESIHLPQLRAEIFAKNFVS
jgi:hypothetical protein